jgi:hypothetical protein
VERESSPIKSGSHQWLLSCLEGHGYRNPHLGRNFMSSNLPRDSSPRLQLCEGTTSCVTGGCCAAAGERRGSRHHQCNSQRSSESVIVTKHHESSNVTMTTSTSMLVSNGIFRGKQPRPESTFRIVEEIDLELD